MKERIRIVKFRPYLIGQGPAFVLELFDFGKSDRIAYQLTEYIRTESMRDKFVIFEDYDFRPSPLHAWDSDETVRAIMSFLTLRLGDTDAEYFDDYTETQIEFRDMHAEYLHFEVFARFGE